jgi:hypothetical protein
MPLITHSEYVAHCDKMTESEYRQHVIDTDGFFNFTANRNKVKKSRDSDTPTKPVGHTTTEEEHIEGQKTLERIHQKQQQKIEMDILESKFKNALDILQHQTDLAHNNAKWKLQQDHQMQVELVQERHAHEDDESEKSIDERDDGDMRNDEVPPMRARNERDWGSAQIPRALSMHEKRSPSMNANT